MKTIYLIIISTFLFSCGKTIDSEYYSETINTFQKVDGKEEIVVQTIYTSRKSDSLTISQLTRTFNYDDDIKIRGVFGIRKSDGLTDTQLDSFYYNKTGKDSLTVNYIIKKNKWVLTQRLKKAYDSDNQIVTLMTERTNSPKSNHLELYSYNSKKQRACETVYECVENRHCDSLFKTFYYYNISGQTDSISNYVWKKGVWIYWKSKEKTSH